MDQISTFSQEFLRLKDVLQILPISKSSLYSGIKAGRYPKQVKLGPRMAAWRKEDIDALVAQLNSQLDGGQ